MTVIQEEQEAEMKTKRVKINQVHKAVKMKEGCQLKDMKKEKVELFTKET